jgi:hypothetical protein
MSDSPEDKPKGDEPQPPPSVDEAREAVSAAMSELFRAVKTLEHAANWHSFFDGWRRGRADLIEEFKKAVAENQTTRETPMPLPATLSREHMLPRSLLSDDLPPNAPAKDRVLQLIRLQPGLRGTELAFSLERSFGIKERTVRTSLHRLRNRKIRNVEGRWYLIENAPADPQLELKE